MTSALTNRQPNDFCRSDIAFAGAPREHGEVVAALGQTLNDEAESRVAETLAVHGGDVRTRSPIRGRADEDRRSAGQRISARVRAAATNCRLIGHGANIPRASESGARSR